MEESEREVISEISCDPTGSLTACKQQDTGGKDGADTDRKLDISSDQFDPLLALYSSEVPLPYPNIRCFNNLAEYESFMKGGRGRAKPENVEKRIRKAKRGVADPERIERLKKLVVKNPCGGEDGGGESGVKRPGKRRAPKNVLTRMPLHEGSPLGELNRCVQRRLRVRVHIRAFKGLRGVCTGFLVAFDKFWNLAMVDVDETYREPLLGEAFYHEKALTVTRLFQKLQVQAASVKAAEAEQADEPSAEPHTVTTSGMLGVRASRQAAERLTPSVKMPPVTSTDVPHISAAGSEQRRKVSTPRVEYGRVRTRHVNQLFIRGENVLLVNIQQE
ncbi:hypothetical protein AMELA_G00095620 [Ameiurus melas]|uniref:LSM domain-containing protein n=1 Tax=Ameiurus melas TaxID=219545 RepID=A0A7J6AS54_AMEME|nr:hypothetical protein AMELA_G00095620 [Ameiurus melas]